MKKIIALVALAISCALMSCTFASGQSVTPNAGLQVPAYQQSNWQVPIIFDLTRLDNVFGGTVAVPSIVLSGPIVNANQAATKAYVDATAVGFLSASGATMTGPLVLAADPTAPLQAATKEYVDSVAAAGGGAGSLTASSIDTALGYAPVTPAQLSTAIASVPAINYANVIAALAFTPANVTALANYLPLTGGAISGTLTLSDGSAAASQDYVVSAVAGLSGTGTGTGGGTTNQLLASKVISASAPGKICAAVAGINGSVQCSGVQGAPLSITVQTGLSSPVLNTVGVTNSAAQYGLNVNSSTNTQTLMPTTVGSYDQATVFKREMWFTGGSNLSGVDNWETDTYDFDKADQWEFMLGWQCNRHNTGFWQYDNFKGGWTNTAVPCSIVQGHVYHYILWMHRDAVTSTACSGKAGTSDSSITSGPCEHWDTFQLDDVTAGTSNTYTLNATYVAEPAALGGWQTWDGVGAQVQLDVVDSTTGGVSTLVSMFTDDDTISAYVPVASSGGSTSVTETTGNLGEFDFDGTSPTTGLTATGSPTLDNTNSYSSPNAALFNSASEYYSGTLSAATSSLYFRAMIDLQTIASGQTTQIVSVNNSSGGQLFNLYLASGSGFISAFNVQGGSGQTCETSALTGWHRLEFAWIEGASTGSYSVSIDGTVTCSATNVNTGTAQAAKFEFGELGTPTSPFVFDMDNVGFSSNGPLGAVTINTSTIPLYDSYGSAAAVKASSLQATNNLSDLANDGAALSNLLDNPVAGTYIIDCTSGTNCVAQAGTGGGSMIWPSSAGIAVYAGSNAWGTSLTTPAGTIVGTTDTQTLTNKTIDGVSPSTLAFMDATSSVQTQLNGKMATFTLTTTGSGAATLSGDVLNIPTYTGVTSINGTTGAFTFTGSGVSCSGTTCTFSSSGGSMVYPSGSGIPIVASGASWGTTIAAPTGTVVGTSDTQTLTNKTLDGVAPATMAFVDPTSSIQTQLNGKLTSSPSPAAGMPGQRLVYDGLNWVAAQVDISEEFLSGSSGTSGQAGQYGWTFSTVSSGAPTFSGGTSTASHPGVQSIATGATSGGGGSATLSSSSNNPFFPGVNTGWIMRWIASPSSITNVAYRIGYMVGGVGSKIPNGGIYFRFDTSLSDTAIMACADNGGTESCTSTAVAPTANGWNNLKMSSTTAGTISFAVDNGSTVTICASGCTLAATVPTTAFSAGADAATNTTTSWTLNLDYFGLMITSIVR